MNNSNKIFRDELLDIEKPNPTLKDKYEIYLLMNAANSVPG